MRKFYLVLLSLCAVCCFGQNQINGYTYWYNNDYASRTIQTIVPQQQVHLSFSAGTSGLSEGLNVFHFQAFDMNGIYSSAVSKFFYKTKGAPSDTNRISAYRYWFNTDVAHIDTVYITPAKQADILAEIDANALNDGLNSINIQVMDQQEIWSSVLSQYFLKSNTHYINAYQYWYNNDIASAVTVDVFPSKIVLINDAIDASALNEGMNILHLRFRDEQNLWSSTISQFFFKTQTGGSDTSKICAYQYWFDNDFAGAVTENITPVAQTHISAAIPTDIIFNGLHVLNIRFKQENGLWSSPLSSYFFKMPESNAAQNLITEYQYWLNSNFAQPVHHVLPQAMPQHELLLSIDMTQMPKGNYVLNLRTKDTLGMWSSVISEPFTKNPFPISSFTADITEFCDSGNVQFTNNSIDGDVYLWDFGDGSYSNLFEPQHFFTLPGQYNVSLTVTDIATQLDSTTSLLITVHPWYHFTDTVNICNGDVYTWRGQSYNQTGVYYDSLTTIYGCDSIYILYLFLQPHYQYLTKDTICQGDTYFWRSGTYTQQGIYYDSLTTEYGCDSVFVLNLIVNPVFEFTQSAAICQGTSYNWRGSLYTVQGIYYDSLSTVLNCDSVYVLHLTVNPVYEFSQTASICMGAVYSWRSHDYTVGGVYYDSLLTQHNCDSVFVLHLSVNPTYEFTQNEEICLGDTLVWRGQNYYASGAYYDAYLSQYGCDSVYMLNLQVNPMYFFMDAISMCDGETILWHGNTYTHAGIYYDSLQTINGCDSVFSLNLSVYPSYYYTELDTFCEGNTYFWRGNYYTAPGTYFDNLNTQHGCDSVYSLELFMRNRPTVSINSIDSLYCVYHAPVSLTAIPQGGVFVGQGVSGYFFSPTSAGIGNWAIVYSYTDPFGCFNADTVFVTVDACTDITDNKMSDIKLYPNPSNGNFTVELSDNTILSLYNALGEQIFSTALHQGKHTLKINYSASGIYLLKAETKNGVKSFKIFINK